MRNCKPSGGARVVVIVLNRNRSVLLAQCLQRLESQTLRPHALILVDDASTDGSVNLAKSMWPGLRTIELPESSGVIAARNAGLACALDEYRAEFFCFLDNDAFLAPTALAEMAAMAEGPEVGIVTPKAFQSLESRCLAAAGGMTSNLYLGIFQDVGYGETDTGQYDTPRDVRVCPGFTLLLRRETAQRVGLFDEGLMRYGWEDVDYSLRVADAGYRLCYAPRAEVEHRGGHAGRGIVASYEFWKLRNLFVLMRRHANALQWTCFLGTLPVRLLFVLIRFASDRTIPCDVLSRLGRLGIRFSAP